MNQAPKRQVGLFDDQERRKEAKTSDLKQAAIGGKI